MPQQHPTFVPAGVLPARRARRTRQCVCVTRGPDSGDAGGAVGGTGRTRNGKRDPIAEWVARARADSRAAREGGEFDGVASDAPPAPASRADRRGAASALDAVDRLFGGAAGPPAVGGVHSTTPPAATPADRERWLDAVRDGAGATESEGAVDVTPAAPEPRPASRRATARQRQRRKRAAAARAAQAAAGAEEIDDGFAEASVEDGDVDAPLQQQSSRSASNRGARRSRKGVGGAAGKAPSTEKENAMNSSFSRLIDIARRGGTSVAQGRSKKPDFEPLSSVLGDSERAQQSVSRGNSERKGTRSGRDVMGVGRLIDLTRRARDGDAGMFDDEDGDDEERRPRQRYVATRRVGGRERRIRDAPADWAPMSDLEIGRLQSESAPLDAGRAIGADPVRDCRDCYGTGLEMCSVCIGAGWVDPPREDEKVRPLVQQLWERPNLVIDRDGTAQCPYCVGIGKRLCKCCEGSGSALRKGFNPGDKYKVFDMFQGGVGGGGLYDEYVADGLEYDNGFDEMEDDEEEVEEDAIYTGEANGFELSLPSLETSAIERETDEDVIELGTDEHQPLQNGFYEEDVVDFGRPPQRTPIKLGRNKAQVVATVLDDEEEVGEDNVEVRGLDVQALKETELMDDDLVEDDLGDEDVEDELEDGEDDLVGVDDLEEENEIMAGADGAEDVLDDPLFDDDDDEGEDDLDEAEDVESDELVNSENDIQF